MPVQRNNVRNLTKENLPVRYEREKKVYVLVFIEKAFSLSSPLESFLLQNLMNNES
jgi:hypothetical protein